MIELNDVMPPIFLYEMPELAEKETGEQNDHRSPVLSASELMGSKRLASMPSVGGAATLLVVVTLN